MFSGWRGVHWASSAIAGFSAVLGEDGEQCSAPSEEQRADPTAACQIDGQDDDGCDS